MGDDRKSSKKKSSRHSRSRSRSRSKERKDERKRRSRSPRARERSRDRRRRSKSRSRSRDDKRSRKDEDKASKVAAVDPKKKEQEELEEQMRLRREKMAKWRAEKAIAEGGSSAGPKGEEPVDSNETPENGSISSSKPLEKQEESSAQPPARIKTESTEDDYFAEQDHETADADAQPQDAAPKENGSEDKMEEEEEDDPLESFMKGVNSEVKKLEEVDRKRMSNTVDMDSLKEMVGGRRVGDSAIGIRSKAEGLGMRMEVEDSIPVVDDEGTGEKEFDIKEWLEAKNQCKNLKPVDHSKVTYAPFRKNFNVIPTEIACMTGLLALFSL
jgi:ATP-dependent RNA helicase DDX46/PRP5